jgi:hypothetical protein
VYRRAIIVIIAVKEITEMQIRDEQGVSGREEAVWIMYSH